MTRSVRHVRKLLAILDAPSENYRLSRPINKEDTAFHRTLLLACAGRHFVEPYDQSVRDHFLLSRRTSTPRSWTRRALWKHSKDINKWWMPSSNATSIA